jgi:MYXO-CTERM domain-containing protein
MIADSGPWPQLAGLAFVAFVAALTWQYVKRRR